MPGRLNAVQAAPATWEIVIAAINGVAAVLATTFLVAAL